MLFDVTFVQEIQLKEARSKLNTPIIIKTPSKKSLSSLRGVCHKVHTALLHQLDVESDSSTLR